MTTRLTSESSPRLPAPSAYTRYLDRVDAEQREFLRRRRNERWMRRVAFSSVAFLAAVIIYLACR